MNVTIAAKTFQIAQAAYLNLSKKNETLRSTKALINEKLDEVRSSGQFSQANNLDMYHVFKSVLMAHRVEAARNALKDQMHGARLCLMLGDHSRLSETQPVVVSYQLILEAIALAKHLMDACGWPFEDAAAEFSGRTGMVYEPTSKADFMQYLSVNLENCTDESTEAKKPAKAPVTPTDQKVCRISARVAFLEAYATEIGDNPTSQENTLLRLFVRAGDQLPIDGGKAWFYRSWRQVDIIRGDDGGYDMMVWEMINKDTATHAVVERLIIEA